MNFVVCIFNEARWLSWLERRPVTAEVVGSSPIRVVFWGVSSAGRASALQAGGHRFEPYTPHFNLGGIPEWPKGTDCKSAGTAFGGSNPPSPITNLMFGIELYFMPMWLNWQSS